MEKISQLRDMNVNELKALYEKKGQELFQLVSQHAAHRLEKRHRIPQVKKEIARILTIITEKQTSNA